MAIPQEIRDAFDQIRALDHSGHRDGCPAVMQVEDDSTGRPRYLIVKVRYDPLDVLFFDGPFQIRVMGELFTEEDADRIMEGAVIVDTDPGNP